MKRLLLVVLAGLALSVPAAGGGPAGTPGITSTQILIGELRLRQGWRSPTRWWMRPGVFVRTSPTNYFPIAKARMVRYRKNLWVLFGPLVNPR